MDKKRIKYSHPVPPFVRYCSAIIPTMFDDSLSYYEALCALNNFIQKNIVEIINNNAAISDSLIKQFEELKEYVDTYFDNLDVQEEINNKLDEMAEDGTLDAIINNYDKCLFVAPKVIDAQISSFDANLILYRDRSIAIDLGYSSVYQAIIDMYSHYNVSSLDYVIISHWDTDHIGNLGQMVTNGVINSDTIVYLPAEPSYVNQTQVANVKSLLEGAGVTYITPTTGNTLEIGLLKITFLNCDLATLEQYADLGDARNLMSTVLLIEHKDVKALYTGDADNEAFQNLYEKHQVNCQIDLFKIGHHGFNVGTFQPFLKAISPKYALQTGSLSRISDATTCFSEQISLLTKLGTIIYACGLNDEYIEFLSDGYDLHVQKGQPLSTSYYSKDTNIYVDVSVNSYDYQDGTEEHPYKELMFALASVSNFKHSIVNIYLADGIYGVTTANPGQRQGSCIMQSLDFRVNIYGNESDNTAVRIYGIYAINTNFTVHNLTLYCDYRAGTELRDCMARFNNVRFNTISGTASSYNGVSAYNSLVTLNECDIQNVNNSIGGSASAITIRSSTISNITSSEIIPTTGDNIYNIRNLNSNVATFAPSYYNPPVMVFDGTQGAATTTATIAGTFSEYQEMVITINTPGSRTVSTGIIYYPRNGLKIPITSSSISSTNGIIFTADLEFSDDNTIAITNQVRYQINRSTGAITVTALSGTDFNLHDVRASKTILLTAPSE